MYLFGSFGAQLSEHDQALVRTAEAFSREHLTDENIAEWSMQGGMPDTVLGMFHDSGLAFASVDTEDNAFKTSFVAQIMMLEEYSRASGTLLPLNSLVVTFQTLSNITTREQMAFALDTYEKTLQPFFSYALTNAGSGSSLDSNGTTITELNGNLVMNGVKPFVNNAEYAPYIMVLASNLADRLSGDADGNPPLTFWLVPRTSPGVTIFPIEKAGQKLLPAAAIEFQDVVLDPDLQLGKRNIPIDLFNRLVSSTRCTACANSLGMAKAALDDAAYYAAHHRIGNRLLADFGQIDEKLADMQYKALTMKYLTYNAAYAIQHELDDATTLAELATRYVPRLGKEVADLGISIVGGAGYTSQSRLSRIWIDSRGNEISVGSPEVMARLIAKDIVRHYLS